MAGKRGSKSTRPKHRYQMQEKQAHHSMELALIEHQEEQLKKEMEEAGCKTVEEFKSHLEKKERNIMLLVFIGLPLILLIITAIA